MIVGLTGGIGSGKTTVAGFFKELGVPVYNSDKEARKLMKNSKKVKKAIIELLGEDAYKGKKLNKTHISDRIFTNEKLLQKLNSIVHPAVRNHFLKWKNRQDAPYVIQETALVFENNSQDFYDKIILVVAPKAFRIQRAARTGWKTTIRAAPRFRSPRRSLCPASSSTRRTVTTTPSRFPPATS